MNGEAMATGAGLLIEEHRETIAASWRRSLPEGSPEPALSFAVAPLLREMSLALRRGVPARAEGHEGYLRCAVLVRSTAQPTQIAREFRLLRRALWDVLRATGHPVVVDERRMVDEWLDEALERSLERTERVRLRFESLERVPQVVPPLPAPRSGPPPLGRARTARLAGGGGGTTASPGQSAVPRLPIEEPAPAGQSPPPAGGAETPFAEADLLE